MLSFAISISPFVSSTNKIKSSAQEDFIGEVPHYLKVEIDKLYDYLIDEQKEFLRKSSIQNIKATLHALNILAGTVHGNHIASSMISILIERLKALLD